MPPDVQDAHSTYNIHTRKHELMEDQHDTSPQEGVLETGPIRIKKDIPG